MEKELRISYFVALPIVAIILYILLDMEQGMAMGVFLIFVITIIPFLLINVARSFDKLAIVINILNIIYILAIAILATMHIDTGDFIIIDTISFILILIMIIESFKNKKYLILNVFCLMHLISFIIYVIT